MTQNARYDLTQKFRVTWHVLAAGGATALFLIGLVLALLLANLRQDMADDSEILLQEWQAIFDESFQLLHRLNTLDAPLCSPIMLKAMRFEEFRAKRIKDIGAFMPGKMLCTTGLGVLPAPFDEGTPDITTTEGLKIHIDTPLLIADLRTSGTVLHIGRFNVIPNRPLMALNTDDITTIALRDLGTENTYTLHQTNAPAAPSSVSSTATLATSSVFDGLDSQACEDRHGLCVRIHRPWNIIFKNETFVLILIGLGGLAGGGLAATAVAHASNHRRTLLRQLHRALSPENGGGENGLTIAYQPIHDIYSQRCVGAEVLARWRDDTQTPVPPDIFVPLAEDNGLIGRLTARVITLASEELSSFLFDYPDFRLSLNISADDLFGTTLESTLETQFLNRGVAARQIVLELTERRLADETAGKATLERLRARGFGIAVDDFGTGYSTLAALRALPFTELKIDRSFVQAINDKAIKASLLPQIIDIARTLSLNVVAEGVETAREQDWLMQHGVKNMQGWLYSPAVGKTDFVAYVATCEARSTS